MIRIVLFDHSINFSKDLSQLIIRDQCPRQSALCHCSNSIQEIPCSPYCFSMSYKMLFPNIIWSTGFSARRGTAKKIIERMEHPYYLPLHSLLLPNHSHWCREEFCLLHHWERMGRMWIEEVH